MSISTAKLEPIARDIGFTDSHLRITLVDGRELRVPLAWFPRLNKATVADRENWQLIGGGLGIHWPAIDEDVSVENLLVPRTP
jgi:Protein of unknown function (DUF2442)